METKEKKKGNTGLIVLVVVLIILLLGSIGYICYDKGVFDSLLGKEKPVVEEPKQEDKLSEEEVMKIHDSLVVKDSDLYFEKNVSIDNISSDEIMPYLLMKYGIENGINFDTTEESPITNCGNNKLSLCKYVESDDGYKAVSVSKDSAVSISKVDIDNMTKSLFNYNKVFELADYTNYDGHDGDSYFIYSKEDNKFYLIHSTQSGDCGTYSSKTKMLKYEQNGNELYIYDKVIRCNGGTCYKTKVFGDDNDIVLATVDRNFSSKFKYTIDEKIASGSGDNFNINFDYIFDKYSNLFNTYKTTFKKANDGKYYWYSSEIVNE